MTRFIRRHTPWWVLWFINRHTHTCWVQMCAWKYDWGESISWCPRQSCWDGPGEGYDYCGRWKNREEMFPEQAAVVQMWSRGGYDGAVA